MPIGQKTITGSKLTPPGVTSTPVTSVGGSVTANAGTLALESGGNLDSIKSNTDTIKTNTTGVALNATLTNKTQYGRLTDGTNDLSLSSYHGVNAVPTVASSKSSFSIHLDAQNVSTTSGFMLIDLSNTTNWHHTQTGHIFLDTLIINTNPSTSFKGDINFGFLSAVDATNGDFNIIHTIHYDQLGTSGNSVLDFKHLGYDLMLNDWFGPTVANDTTFQTDVNLQGPDGATSYPSGDGDFVMKITVTAGNVDVGVTAKYETVA